MITSAIWVLQTPVRVKGWHLLSEFICCWPHLNVWLLLCLFQSCRLDWSPDDRVNSRRMWHKMQSICRGALYYSCPRVSYPMCFTLCHFLTFFILVGASGSHHSCIQRKKVADRQRDKLVCVYMWVCVCSPVSVGSALLPTPVSCTANPISSSRTLLFAFEFHQP